MKTKVFVFASALLICCNLFAQKVKITKNEVDKFNGMTLIETNQPHLFRTNFMGTGYNNGLYLGLRKANDDYYLLAGILLEEIVKYDENSGITFLFENGETISLSTLYTGIGGESFAKGYTFDTVFKLSKSDIEALSSHKITDVRIRYFSGSYDHEIDIKRQDLVIREFEAINK